VNTASSPFSVDTGLDLKAGTFTPVGLKPVRLGDDGLPDYDEWASQIVYNLDAGRQLLEDPIAWRAYHFPRSHRSAPLADFQAWLWRWLTSGCRRLAIALPAEHAKTTETTRYMLFRLLKCDQMRIGNFQKSDDQAQNVLLQVQATLAQPEFIRLYGIKRPPKNQEGFPWSTHKMRFTTNESGEMTHNLQGWTVGAIAGALGSRLDLSIEDDINTEKNTATPTMRMKIRQWQGMVVDKTMTGADQVKCDCGGHDQQIRVGTPFWEDDSLMYTQEIAGIKIGPSEWNEPDELTAEEKKHWVFIHKDCEVGKKPGTTLWQFRYSLEKLHYLRDEDPSQILTYERRMRCNVRRLEDIKFDPAWFKGGTSAIDGLEYRGCFNHRRSLGELPPRFDEMKVVSANDPMAGRQGDHTSEYCNQVWAMLPRGKRRYIIDSYTGIIKQVLGHDFLGRFIDESTQVGTMIYRHRKYGCSKTGCENNGQQGAWIAALMDVKDGLMQSEIEEWNTGASSKSLDVGVPSLVPLFQLGLVDIPYKDERSKRFAAKLVEQFYKWDGAHSTKDDVVMTSWMANGILKGASGVIDFSGVTSLQEVMRRPPIASRRSPHLRAVS